MLFPIVRCGLRVGRGNCKLCRTIKLQLRTRTQLCLAAAGCKAIQRIYPESVDLLVFDGWNVNVRGSLHALGMPSGLFGSNLVCPRFTDCAFALHATILQRIDLESHPEGFRVDSSSLHRSEYEYGVCKWWTLPLT